MCAARKLIQYGLGAALAAVLSVAFAFAQSTLYSPGLPTQTTTIPIEHGFINVANGNVHLEFPFAAHKQRGGIVTTSKMVYDSGFWTGGMASDGSNQWMPTNVPGDMGGWRYVDNLNTIRNIASYATVPAGTSTCSNDPGNTVYSYGPFIYIEYNGTTHTFPVQTTFIEDQISGCTDPNHPVVTSGSGYAIDGSGYYIVVNNYMQSIVYNAQGVQVATNINPTSAHYQEDLNGNYTDDDGVDDLGRQLVTQTSNGNTTTYSVLIENGQRVSYTVTTETFNVYTHFLSDSIGTDYNGPLTVVKSIGLPDGTSYQFAYEQPGSDGRSFGELTGMALPHGGNVSFEYRSGMDGTRAGVDVPARWVSQYIGGSGETDLSIIPVSSNCSGGRACSITQDTYVTRNGVTSDYAYNLDAGRGGLFNVAIATFPVTVSPTFGTPSATVQPPSTPLQVNYTTYTAGVSCPSYICSSTGYMYTEPETSVTVFSDSGKAKAAVTQYSTQNQEAAGIPDSTKIWDYYTTSTAPYQAVVPTSNPSKEEDVTYGYSANGALYPTVRSVTGPSGMISYETFFYNDVPAASGDHSGIVSLPGNQEVTHHDSSYGNKGLLTGHYVYENASQVANNTASIVYLYKYYPTGSLYSAQDPNGNITTYGYDPTNTLVTSATGPAIGSVTHSQSTTYDADGSVLSSTDQNGQVTTVTYDGVGRRQSLTSPNGNQATYGYPSPNQTTVTESQSNGVKLTSSSTVDGFGRFISGTHGTVSYSTMYDTSGRVSCKATPSYSGTSSTTDGSTCYGYDPYDRITQITQPDQTSNVQVQYTDNVATITDELGHKRTQTSDASGNLITVMEPDASGGLNWETDYTYDTLNRLVGITQKGGSTSASQWRSRSFNYDFVRLLSKSTPEGGLLTYDGYDANGNVVSQTDAQGLNVKATYDAYNRVTRKVLSSGVAYTYTYDGADSSGDPFPIGNMTSASGPNSGEYFKHDVSGNLTSEAFCTPSDCSYTKAVQAVYDYHGNITSLTYPDGRQVTSHFDPNDRPLDVTYAAWNGQAVNIPYASQMIYYPPGLPQSAVYGNGVNLAAGVNNRLDLTSLKYTLGSNSDVLLSKTYNWDKNAVNLTSLVDNKTGTTRTFGYDMVNRLQSAVDTVSGGSGPGTDGTGTVTLSGQEQAVSKTICVVRNGKRSCTPATVYDSGTIRVSIGSMTQTVSYGGGSSAVNLASAIASAFNKAASTPATATVNGSTVTFTAATDGSGSDYGLSASVTGSDPSDFPTPSFGATDSGSSLQGGTTGTLLSETYTPDPWGNLQQSGNFSFVQPFDANNHVSASGITYFANGNLQTDGLGGSYTYDSENHILTANGTTYTYDPMGNRVRKDGTGSTEFYYFGSQLLATLDPGSGSWNDYIYGAGRLLAENAGQATAVAQFRIGDNLDSLNLLTDGAGNPTGNFDFAPYGQLFNNTGSDLVLFTDHERDTESNSDHTQYRQLSLAQSRWFSPDPSDGSYNLADPQSLNRYTYLGNRPLSGSDPTGLFISPATGLPIASLCGPECQLALLIGGGILDIAELLFGGGGPGVVNEHYSQVVGVGDDAQGAASGSAAPSGQAAPLDDNADLYTVGPDPGSFGESLGIPTGLKVDDGGILGILGLPSPGCEFGACSGGSYLTGSAGASVNYTLPFGLSGTLFFGIVCDTKFHCGLYSGGGGGVGLGAGASGGIQVGYSNGNTICAFGGPFANYSGSFGLEAAGTVDYFEGEGDAPGGVVRGVGVTGGGGATASASVTVTETAIRPFGRHTCVNGVVQ